MFLNSNQFFHLFDSSIVMQDTKTEANANNSMLCFVILSSITDDQFANSLMHDVNLQFKVDLYRPPTRRYMFVPDKSPKPLAAALLGSIILYLVLTKLFDVCNLNYYFCLSNINFNHYNRFIKILYCICYRFDDRVYVRTHDEKIAT